MSDVTALRCWPCCVDAIDWSQDGIIALASDDVELLFPNTESYDRDSDVASWKHIPLQVSWFTKDELPVKEPAPLPTYSIGEEISASLATRIAWSPPGLAKHRRCALGSLTGNLVFAIWSADGKPQDDASWKRRLIVNDALMDYFNGNAAEEDSHLTSDPKEKIRLRSRIRAFAWAPALPSPWPTGTVGTQPSWGQQLVAVSNDDNQVVFLVIDSPTSTLGTERWRAEVLNHLSVTPDSESVFSDPFTFDDIIQQQRHISHLAWSPWVIRGDWYHSVLVYATNEDVRARVVTYTHDTIGLGDEVVYPNIEIRYGGPMKWSPQVENGDKLILSVFTSSEVICLFISASDATIISRTSHHLDGRWDQISGAVWDHAPKLAPRLHFCSHTSTMTSPTSLLKLSENALCSLSSPNWLESMSDTQALFSVQHGLKGNAMSKVWGLSLSPLGDFIASSQTVHPSDMLEYGAPVYRHSSVAITSLRSYGQVALTFPAGNVSAEGVAFTVRKWYENTVESVEDTPEFANEVLDKLMQAYAPNNLSTNVTGNTNGNGDATTLYDAGDLTQLVSQFKQNALLDPHTIKDRYTILISQVCTPGQPHDLARTLIAFRLADALQKLPARLSRATPFSSEILAQHQQLIHLVLHLADESTMDAEGEPDDASPSAQLEPSITNTEADTCDFCGAAIPFTDLRTATCTNGHKFPRCGLSFLAIQEPRISKYCGMCNTPFLSEGFVAAQEVVSRPTSRQGSDSMLQGYESLTHKDGGKNGDGEGREGQDAQDASVPDESGLGLETVEDEDEVAEELPMSLARVLFLACDVCIYCGGKLVG